MRAMFESRDVSIIKHIWLVIQVYIINLIIYSTFTKIQHIFLSTFILFQYFIQSGTPFYYLFSWLETLLVL